MSSPNSPNLCIIGNGAIGKTAALALSNAGLSVTLLCPPDQAQPQKQTGWDFRVYALNQVAHTLLSSLNVWQALDTNRIAPIEKMLIKGDAQKYPGTLELDAFASHVNTLGWIVEDSNLNQALDAALRFAAKVKIVHGRATKLHADLSDACVELDNGSTLRAQLVVGADGAQSWVRGQCEISTSYRSYGQEAIVANFECEKSHQGVAYQWFTPAEGIVALLPLPGSRVSLVWSAPYPLAKQLCSLSLPELARRVTTVSQSQLGALHPLEPQQSKSFPLTFIRAHSTVAPRVVLMGDAAHVVHPLAGQGMNLGFGDVATFAQILSEQQTHEDCGAPQLLSRYARARKKDVLLMQLTTDGLARLFAAQTEPLSFVRNLGLNVLNQFPIIKRRMVAHALGTPS